MDRKQSSSFAEIEENIIDNTEDDVQPYELFIDSLAGILNDITNGSFEIE